MKNKILSIGALLSFFPERAIFIIYYLHIGLSIFDITLIQGTISITQFFLEVPTGILSDKIGRKNTLLIGSLLVMIYYILLIFSTNFIVLLIANFFLGLGLTFQSGADESYIYEELEDYEKTLRLYMLIGSLSLGVSIVIGGFLSDINWQYVFIVALIIQTIGMFVILSLPKINVSKNKKNITKQIYELKKLFKELIFSNNILIILFFLLIDSFFWFYYMIEQINMTNLGITNFNLSLFYFIITVIIILIPLFKVKRSFEKLPLFILMIFSAYIFLTDNTNIYVEFTLLLISQIYLFKFLPSLSEQVHNLLPNRHRNKLISTMYSISSILIWIFYMIFGVLQTILSPLQSTYIMFIVILIMIGFIIIFIKKCKTIN